MGYSIQREYHREVSKTKFTQANNTFRELLKEFRMAKNLSQTDVAARLGRPQSYVSKYETGERRLDFAETVFVCDALGIGIEKFAATVSSKLAKFHRVKDG